MDATELLADCQVVPVVVIEDHNNAVELAATLHASGIGAIEVTLRSAAALKSIQLIAKQVPDIIVGAGSVRAVDHFAAVVDAGAQFAVSPGATEALIKGAHNAKLPYIHGAATASENLFLLEHGYSLQKFFPAELSGGLPMIKALSAPLPEVRFFPTGGVTAELAVDYLATPCVQCVGGTWIAKTSLINSRDFDEIGELAQNLLN